ncbi:MAG: metallophosphoesterase [Bacteroidota bacterium]
MRKILHISDLHLTKVEYEKTGEVNTWYEKDLNFIDKLVTSIQKNLSKGKLDNIVITGDIANKSNEDEYKVATKFLEELCTKLSFSKNDVLIIPGNHDINWLLCEGYYSKHNSEVILNSIERKQPYETNEKYNNFIFFYNSFYGEEIFNPNKSIVWSKVYDDLKIILVGLNTNEHECHLPEFHYGYISHPRLESEIRELVNKYNEYRFVIFSHHIITPTNEDNKAIKNQDEILTLLNVTNRISTFLCGHQHTGGGRKSHEEFANEIISLGVGSLAKIGNDIQNSYNILELKKAKNKIQLVKKEVDYTLKNSKRQWGAPTIFQYNLYSINNIVEEIPDLESKDILIKNSKAKKKQVISPIVFIDSPRINEYSRKIINIVKENDYLKSGHFHWSPNSRTLGAIDTSAMFMRFQYLSLAKSALIDLVHENNIIPELIVGLGMEGNLLSANISSIIGCKSSYCPYIIRKDYHLKHETYLDFKGIKKLALITDVTHKGITVRDLLIDRKDLFKEIEEIYLLSIFYTSKHVDYSPSIFKKFDQRINFYSVCKAIKIEDCSYCDEVKDNCLFDDHSVSCKICSKNYINCTTYKMKLEPVFTFY